MPQIISLEKMEITAGLSYQLKLAELARQPSPCEVPVTLSRGQTNAQRFGRLRLTQAAKETQLNHFRCSLIQRLQPGESFVHGQKPFVEANRSAVALQEFEFDVVSTTLITLHPSRVIYQNSVVATTFFRNNAHNLMCGGAPQSVRINADLTTATGGTFDRWVTLPGGTANGLNLTVNAQTNDVALAHYRGACHSGYSPTFTATVSECSATTCPVGQHFDMAENKCVSNCPSTCPHGCLVTVTGIDTPFCKP